MNEVFVEVDASMYPNGLNGDFVLGAEDAWKMEEKYGNGTGKFEDKETRDIAKHLDLLMKEFCADEIGVKKDAVVLDVGAGTGLLVNEFAQIVGKGGHVYATEISEAFAVILRKRFADKKDIVDVVISTDDSMGVDKPGHIDVICICDVYHHFTKPLTMMREAQKLLKTTGKLVVIDFHRDSSRITSHEAGWVERHVRADQATFRSEIESVGFQLLSEPCVEGMNENYIMVFEKTNAS
uniref:Methyltransferase type 12 domain-containing protein n=1 Tax=Mucochytrium quahogii TaxID=96639 RepID=A0A7S2WNM5_9STRA|mmetsp:Transcript_10510/g.17138  ORF Transcript_10510/g.17138 Transcript_10510/m.17138 type:complete len:238 (+) Transcript_10510:363-1076(+)